MNQKRAKFLRLGLPVLVLLLAIGITMALFVFKQPPQKEQPQTLGPVVETMTVQRRSEPLEVHGYGSVMPARRAWIQTEVEGKIVELHPAVRPGGRVKAGELLVQVDPRVYRHQVAEAAGQLAQAESELALEEGRQDVAELDWEYYQQNVENEAPADRALALREPQMASARAQVQTAAAQLDRARLQLDKASIAAPFDGFIRQEDAEIGQLVSPQTQLIELIGDDVFWVEASLPVRQLDRLRIPGFNATPGQASRVRVIQELGERRIEREGRVSRLYGDLDENGSMARVLIEVEDPLRLPSAEAEPSETPELPLLLNAYVEVRIETPMERPLVEVPWSALREGNQVYVYREGKLHLQPVDIVWQTPEHFYVGDELQEDDRLVTSPLSNPVQGMKLRRAEEVERQRQQNQQGGPGQESGGQTSTSNASAS
ncbi:MAG: efflux RND transporter periplasmic adaptor subunit [Verrucomicrobiota bacterium JB022]|nr:efflux RND transporter periplasmic adaptor subunit [Verrucomicrobiota bacterium JB022]